MGYRDRHRHGRIAILLLQASLTMTFQELLRKENIAGLYFGYFQKWGKLSVIPNPDWGSFVVVWDMSV